MAYFSKLGLLDSPIPKPSFIGQLEEEKESGQQGAKSKDEILTNLIRQIKCGEIQDVQNELQKIVKDGFNPNLHFLRGIFCITKNKGWSCLHYAAHMGRRLVIKLLIEQ